MPFTDDVATACAHLLAGGVLLGHDEEQVPLSAGPLVRAVSPEAKTVFGFLVGAAGDVDFEGDLFDVARYFVGRASPQSVSFR